MTTDDHGRFQISGLSRKVYEFVVVHAVQGRVLARRRVDGGTVVLRLREMPRVRGRVLIDQLPAAGVPIRAVPHQRDFERARDPIGFVAPGVVTGIDGRFDLSVPPRGTGELLIGGREVGIVRYPYATTGQLPMVSELGDIVLSGPREVLVQLEPWFLRAVRGWARGTPWHRDHRSCFRGEPPASAQGAGTGFLVAARTVRW